MQITRVDPPQRGFYAKELDVRGTYVRAHADVADEAVLEAGRRIERLIGLAGVVADNLASAGAEMHVIGRAQKVTDLPMYRHMAGKKRDDGLTRDERARGDGGLHACCSEDSLLGLPTRRHRDNRDICSHELAHTVLSYGLDTSLRSRVEERYEDAKRLWRSAYAAKNAKEFFAELTMWYVGSRGDYSSLPAPSPGPEWRAHHDWASYELLDAIYTGRLEPHRIVWEQLQPTAATKLKHSREPVTLLFVNDSSGPLEKVWLSFKGERRAYGQIQPGAVSGRSTFATHPWALVDERGRDVGVFVATKAGHAMARVTDE